MFDDPLIFGAALAGAIVVVAFVGIVAAYSRDLGRRLRIARVGSDAERRASLQEAGWRRAIYGTSGFSAVAIELGELERAAAAIDKNVRIEKTAWQVRLVRARLDAARGTRDSFEIARGLVPAPKVPIVKPVELVRYWSFVVATVLVDVTDRDAVAPYAQELLSSSDPDVRGYGAWIAWGATNVEAADRQRGAVLARAAGRKALAAELASERDKRPRTG